MAVLREVILKNGDKLILREPEVNDAAAINISLGVRASNYNAIRLYEKFGFRKVGVHKNYFYINGKYDDEYIMDLYLDK